VFQRYQQPGHICGRHRYLTLLTGPRVLPLYKSLLSRCLLIVSLLIVSQVSFAGITLTADQDVSTAGYYQLNWQQKSPGNVELQEARSKDFIKAKTLYLGPDQASFISGRQDGEYFYRARPVESSNTSDWSNTVKVTVKHHSLNRAFLFFTAGAIVFLLILFVIHKGSRLEK
jgi:hypothetical protein